MTETDAFDPEKLRSPDERIEGISLPDFDFSRLDELPNDTVAFDYRRPVVRHKVKIPKIFVMKADSTGKRPEFVETTSPSLDLVITVGDIRRIANKQLENPEYADLAKRYIAKEMMLKNDESVRGDKAFHDDWQAVSEAMWMQTPQNFSHIPEDRNKWLTASAQSAIDRYCMYLVGQGDN